MMIITFLILDAFFYHICSIATMSISYHQWTLKTYPSHRLTPKTSGLNYNNHYIGCVLGDLGEEPYIVCALRMVHLHIPKRLSRPHKREAKLGIDIISKTSTIEETSKGKWETEKIATADSIHFC